MTDPIFLFSSNDTLTPLNEKLYEKEEDLQAIIADHPELIVSVTESVGDLVLVKREAGVPGGENEGDAFSLDHLFFDSDGVPTLIEVKRSSDTRIRREVVGQMLDYAAHAGPYWSVDTLKAMFVETWTALGEDPDAVIDSFLSDETDPEQFWQRVKINLQAGRMRLIFAADTIPRRLKRVVEFLNDQMDPCEVLAVEIRQFTGEGGLRMVAPRMVGQSVIAGQRKGMTQKRKWNHEDFISELTRTSSPDLVPVIEHILAWAKEKGLRIWWGEGYTMGSFYPIHDISKHSFQVVAFWTTGKCEVFFHVMKKRYKAFESREQRLEFLQRLNAITGAGISTDRIDGAPKFDFSVLRDEQTLNEFLIQRRRVLVQSILSPHSLPNFFNTRNSNSPL